MILAVLIIIIIILIIAIKLYRYLDSISDVDDTKIKIIRNELHGYIKNDKEALVLVKYNKYKKQNFISEDINSIGGLIDYLNYSEEYIVKFRHKYDTKAILNKSNLIKEDTSVNIFKLFAHSSDNHEIGFLTSDFSQYTAKIFFIIELDDDYGSFILKNSDFKRISMSIFNARKSLKGNYVMHTFQNPKEEVKKEKLLSIFKKSKGVTIEVNGKHLFIYSLKNASWETYHMIQDMIFDYKALLEESLNLNKL